MGAPSAKTVLLLKIEGLVVDSPKAVKLEGLGRCWLFW